MSLRAVLAVGLATATLATLGATAPAALAASPGTALRLTLTYPGTDLSGARTVLLTCDPPGGQHPGAAAACAQLARNRGRFTRHPGDAVCTMEYSPVRAQATGRWRGRSVRFAETFPNDCQLRARTGAIFAF